jgi:hypothetical protein
MEQNSNIERKVAEALSSLDGMRKAVPAPYFYTRLVARMERSERNIWERFGSFISRPAVAFSTICLILLLNTMALFKEDSSVKTALIEPNEQTMNNAYDVASSTANSTILTIWNPEDDQ